VSATRWRTYIGAASTAPRPLRQRAGQRELADRLRRRARIGADLPRARAPTRARIRREAVAGAEPSRDRRRHGDVGRRHHRRRTHSCHSSALRVYAAT
jgi:hypothetical protein